MHKTKKKLVFLLGQHKKPWNSFELMMGNEAVGEENIHHKLVYLSLHKFFMDLYLI
jgi:hypothetical protein